MIQIEGLYWPDDVGDRWKHALMHVKSVEWSIARCKKRRTAVQAGGNVGLWPRRLAQSFEKIVTFEPDDASRACLTQNVPTNVIVHHSALGSSDGRCGLKHRGLGSHNVVDGDSVQMLALDGLALNDVDFIQLDVEGYEGHALQGAAETVGRCKPMIQVELRDGPLERHGSTSEGIRGWLAKRGYRQVSSQQGSDFVFEAS